jgi:hypothetical protein
MDILQRGEPQVLRRGEIAEKVRSVIGGQGSPDGSRHMVISRSMIHHQGSQDVERGFGAELFFEPHIFLDTVQRDVTRSFHHHLYPCLSAAGHKFSQNPEFSELSFIVGVCGTSWPEAVPQREGDVEFSGDFENAVEVFIKKALLIMLPYPIHHEGSPSAYHPEKAFFHKREMLL